MKTIGLIGGMSWESSVEYYRIINERVAERLGGLHSARCLLYSLDFAEIEELQREGRWEAAAKELASCGTRLARAGADFLLLCTNTMHKVADAVEREVGLPLLHIADAAGKLIVEEGHRRIGLLGTRFTMEEGFYAERLAERFGLSVLTPSPEDRALVHRTIYEELVKGIFEPASREEYLRIIADLEQRGAEAVLLACTEIGLLVKQGSTSLPLFDTAEIHALAAADFALSPAAT